MNSEVKYAHLCAHELPLTEYTIIPESTRDFVVILSNGKMHEIFLQF